MESSSRYRAFRRKRQAWYLRAQFTILRNPFIPLAFRLTIFVFALVALGLGTSIWKETGRITDCIHQDPRGALCVALVGEGPQDYYRDPSGLMAIIVDAIALLYTIYITYDEYFSKPLGLRHARAKVRLVLLDLFFVVFQSANLSLSFESLTVDEGACQVGDSARTNSRFDHVCHRAQALSAVLLVSLTAWLMTFSVSVLRYVVYLKPGSPYANDLADWWKESIQIRCSVDIESSTSTFANVIQRDVPEDQLTYGSGSLARDYSFSSLSHHYTCKLGPSPP